MAEGSPAAGSLKDAVSAEEWRVRVELAALYRLAALHGWDDLIYTHISARAPGPEHHFLINPYGLLFEEITASSLIKIDLQGEVLQDTDQAVNQAGFVIHSALHEAREDAAFVMHLHSDDGVAVSAQAHGLLPISQHALVALPQLALHDYEGIALNLDERERLVRDMGDRRTMLLRNHGTLAMGRTAAECWVRMYFLEKACTQQVKALAGGRGAVLLAPEAAREVVKAQTAEPPDRNEDALGGHLAWAACLRRLEREAPGYDA